MNLDSELQSIPPATVPVIARRACLRALPVWLKYSAIGLVEKLTIERWLQSVPHGRQLNPPAVELHIALGHATRQEPGNDDVRYGMAVSRLANASSAIDSNNEKQDLLSEQNSPAAISSNCHDSIILSSGFVHQKAGTLDPGYDLDRALEEDIAFCYRDDIDELPLWPTGEPQWYLDAQEEAERVMEEQRRQEPASDAGPPNEYFPGELVLELDVPEGATPKEVIDTARKLAAIANGLYKHIGGSGLKVNKLDIYEHVMEEAQ